MYIYYFQVLVEWIFDIVQILQAKELVSLFFMDNISNNVLGVNSNCFTDPDSDFRKMADLQMKEALQTWWKVMIMTNLPKLRDVIGLRWGSRQWEFQCNRRRCHVTNCVPEVRSYTKDFWCLKMCLTQLILIEPIILGHSVPFWLKYRKQKCRASSFLWTVPSSSSLLSIMR